MPTLMHDKVKAIQLIGIENVIESVKYPFRKAWAEARWERNGAPRTGLGRLQAFVRTLQTKGAVWPTSWRTTGSVVRTTPLDSGVSFLTEAGRLDLRCLAPNVMHTRYGSAPITTPETLPYSHALTRPLDAGSPPPFHIVETDEAIFLLTAMLTVGILRETAAVFFADASGRLLHVTLDAAGGPAGEIRHRTVLAEDEHLFGLGERTTVWNRRGRTHVLWNQDPGGYRAGDDPININIPTYVGLHDNGSYLVFYDNPGYAEFDLGAGVSNVAEHRFRDGDLQFVFIAGPVPELLEHYTGLTGRHDIPPLWMLGYHQSRWSYTPESRVRKLVEDFRKHDVPCDAIYLDINYMDGFRNFTWDRNAFPDPPGLIAALAEQGIKLVTIIDAGVKRDPNYAPYRSGLQGRHFCTSPDGSVFHAPVWPGLCAFPDFTAARTRAWWGELYRPLIEAGVAGFWNDMNEPAAFSATGGSTLPDIVQHHTDHGDASHATLHNIYGMSMVEASRDGILRLRPDKRPVVITRAGWASVQRYAISWTGDNESSWESLRLTVPMMLALGLSGIGFSGPDIGGFAGEANGELFTRWLQMGVFMPLFRAHTVANTPDQEPWSYGEPYLSINRRFIQLRYELLPYLYTTVWQMTTRGWPMVRPLWWLEQQAPGLWDIDDAFLCGDALLVAPVVDPQTTTREITLPAGAWYDFWTHRLRRGPETFEQFAPLESIPLFIRAGAVLPLGEIGPSVEQRPDKFLRLDAYLLPEDGAHTSWLYEDAGEGFAYRQDQQRRSRFTLRRTGNQITLTWERAGAYAPPYEHIALTLKGLHRTPQSVQADGQRFPIVATDPVQRTALLGVPPFDRLTIDL